MYLDQHTLANRQEAGKELAGKLLNEPLITERMTEELLVLSIPRGGVVVGAAIAEVLGAAHEVIVVKKIGFPGQPELAMGAVAENGLVILNKEMLAYCYEMGREVGPSIEQATAKVDHYITKFRSGRPLDIQAKTVILTDDGIATGETMKAAIRWATFCDQTKQAKTLIVAVPVCSPRTAEEIKPLVDELVCLALPEMFFALGQFYQNFEQISDGDVLRYLKRVRQPMKAAA